MHTLDKPNLRAIPPLPGGGSYTFNEEQWAWISNDPAPAEVPAAAGNEQAELSAIDQE